MLVKVEMLGQEVFKYSQSTPRVVMLVICLVYGARLRHLPFGSVYVIRVCSAGQEKRELYSMFLIIN